MENDYLKEKNKRLRNWNIGLLIWLMVLSGLIIAGIVVNG